MNWRNSFRIILQQVLEQRKNRRNRTAYLENNPLDPKEKKILDELIKNGICIVENYWSREKCAEIKSELENAVSGKKDSDFGSGAYIRFNQGKTVKDDGVIRIYHVEKEFSKVASFRNDPFILKLAAAYYGIPMHSAFIAFQHNFLSDSGTREYHVDWWDKEFKAFVYLEDVELDNGPFAYILGSNKAGFTKYKKILKNEGSLYNTSFFDDDLDGWLKKEKILTAKSGTLILADVSGFHRGLPQLKKTRSILYNNIFSKNTDLFPQK